MGKPTGIQEDEAIRGANAWYRGSKYNHPYDVHLVAYTELLKIVSRFHESIHTPSGTVRVLIFKVSLSNNDLPSNFYRALISVL
ncbi:hypothetical protein BU17DRAFT_103451 [Hysterangium stoloniferum]|nr:hypothetical protein BU17DRAFT_103451 [Hysterangium stoloniferum]